MLECLRMGWIPVPDATVPAIETSQNLYKQLDHQFLLEM